MIKPMPTISIVFGTLNRLAYLKQALASIPTACGNLSYEIIVVDGGSTDGTLDYLTAFAAENSQVKVLQQGERLGAVKAFRAGFDAATGEFVAAFNDDARYVGQPLAHAVAYLRDHKDVGQIALPYLSYAVADPTALPVRVRGEPQVQKVRLGIGTVPYANFSVIARALGAALDWWGTYYQYAGDTELSAKVWASGLRVEPLTARGHYVIHYEAQDATRVPNIETPQFDARWRNPNQPWPPSVSK